ncbi:hypothetical protein ESB04_11405 [Aquirufa rosea]|uniref:Fibronectin type-III domain-containing protein n=2 Tax=Aquirufa rosea TaxID=2509241 RepID=A0A4Q1BXT3_9BACT|nr:hypothetical protein ESB04_11405 [Aquirufa rosea]
MKKLFCIFGLSIFYLECSSGGENIVPVVESPPPFSAILSIPVNGSVCVEGQSSSSTMADVDFAWTLSKDTDFYEIIVTNLLNLTNISKTVKGDKTTISLSKGIPYSWQIISKSDKVKQTASSALWKFYLAGDGISTYAPFPATATSPTPGSSITAIAGKVNLAWIGSDPDSKILSYEIFIDMDVNKVYNHNMTPLKSSNPNLLVNVSSGMTYYWSIKTSDGAQSSFSVVYSFRVN